MAVQVINDPFRTFGGGIGYSAGTGVSGGLAQHLEELAQERLLGLKNRYSRVEDEIGRSRRQDLAKTLGLEAGLADLGESGFAQHVNQKYAPKNTKPPIKITEEQGKHLGLKPDDVTAFNSFESPEVQKLALQQHFKTTEGQEVLKRLQGIENSVTGQPNQTPEETGNKPAFGGGIGANKALETAKYGQGARAEVAKENRFNAKEKKENERYLYDNFLKPRAEKETTSTKNISDYENIKKIARSGQLRNPVAQKILDRLGLSELWATPGQQLASTIVTGLTTGAGSAFNTSRLTNLDVGLYKQSLLRLTNDADSIAAIADNEILENKANLITAKIAREIVSKDPTISILEAENELDRRAGPELKKLADEAQHNVDNVLAIQNGLGKEEDNLPAPSKGDKYYVEELGTFVESPDGKDYIREDNGQVFDWKAYNKGAR